MGTVNESESYLHGYTAEEQDRLIEQARYLEDRIHDRLPFRRCNRLVEVGCGVGAQTSILTRYFPDLHVTGLDRSEANLTRARALLEGCAWATGRYEFVQAEADTLPFDPNSFDGAFLCWILEHVADPLRVLSEVRRVLRVGSPIVCNEVLNATFFIDPYSPATLDFWRVFNDHQYELGGDPFVGAKLGNLLQTVGARDVETEVKVIHLDNRQPGERAQYLGFWTDLLLSAAPGLLKSGRTDEATVEQMKKELSSVGRNPNAVFFYSFVQARARVW